MMLVSMTLELSHTSARNRIASFVSRAEVWSIRLSKKICIVFLHDCFGTVVLMMSIARTVEIDETR